MAFDIINLYVLTKKHLQKKGVVVKEGKERNVQNSKKEGAETDSHAA